MIIDRRTACISLAALTACHPTTPPVFRPGRLKTGVLDRRFPALAARAGAAAFAAGMIAPESGQTWFWNGDVSLPMEDLFILPLAVAALAEVDAGRLKLGERIKIADVDLSPPYSAIDQAWPTPPQGHAAQMPAVDLISLAVQQGDHTAADVIMRRIGGPGAVTAWLQGKDLGGIRVDRYAREVEQEIAAMAPFRPEWKDEAAWLAARDTVAPAAREAAMSAYLGDPRDRATVRAFVTLIDRLATGDLLSPVATRLIFTLMATSRTGANRLAAGLPAGAAVAQAAASTRTDLGLTPTVGDAGLVTFKGGARVVMAAFLAGSTATQADRDRLFSDAARLFILALS